MDNKNYWNIALAFLGCALVIMAPDASFATGGNPIGDVLCTVRGWFNGPVGAGIATLAVIIIGIGALLGKVSWGMAMIVGIGVAIVFGADAIITALGAENFQECPGGGA